GLLVLAVAVACTSNGGGSTTSSGPSNSASGATGATRASGGTARTGATGSTAPVDIPRKLNGFRNIQHLVFIVQENRSFDHYFGTFPGADGIPMKPNGTFAPCIPDPNGPCRRPYHDRNTVDGGGPHGSEAATTDINGGRMDGFLQALEIKGNVCMRHPHQAP